MIFERHEKVLFKHCDLSGIAFFPRYFEMINDCIEHFFADALDWPFEVLLKDAGVPTAEIKTQFLAPSRHGETLTLILEITRAGRTSLSYVMRASSGGQDRFRTEARLVYVTSDGRPSPWPEPIKTRLKQLESAA